MNPTTVRENLDPELTSAHAALERERADNVRLREWLALMSNAPANSTGYDHYLEGTARTYREDSDPRTWAAYAIEGMPVPPSPFHVASARWFYQRGEPFPAEWYKSAALAAKGERGTNG